jgi:hypothetical protein
MSIFALFSDWAGEEEAPTVCLGRSLRVRLTDPDRNLIPGGLCRIVGESKLYELDAESIADIPLPAWNLSTLDLEWEPAEAQQNGEGDRFYWQATVDLSVRCMSEDACVQRLENLGFCGNGLSERVSAYETFLGRACSGSLAGIEQELVAWHDGRAPGGADGGGQTGAGETCQDLVRRIYAAFNDSGFLGLGGTDEDEVLAVLTIARDRGMMAELRDLYAQEHPDEPGLEEELDDELSGKDYRSAMEVYRQGLGQ